MTDQTTPAIRTSDKLALSAAFSVLMMTVYVLFGGDAARPALAPIAIEAPVQAATLSLRPLRTVLTDAGARRIALY